MPCFEEFLPQILLLDLLYTSTHSLEWRPFEAASSERGRPRHRRHTTGTGHPGFNVG